MLRNLTAKMMVPLLKLTDLRFSKAWRTNEKGFKAFVFKHILNTTRANQMAGFTRKERREFTAGYWGQP